MELHQLVPIILCADHSGRQQAFAKGKLCADGCLAPGLCEAFPDVAAGVLQKQNLHSAAAGPFSEQTGGKHTGVVQNQAVAGTKIVKKIVKKPVFEGTVCAMHHQKAGAVPLRDP